MSKRLNQTLINPVKAVVVGLTLFLVSIVLLSFTNTRQPVVFASDSATATVTGYVKDAETLRPIAGAGVKIARYKNSLWGKWLAKTKTDEKGFYTMEVIPEGKAQIIRFSKPGYQTIKGFLFLSPGGNEKIDVVLNSTGKN